MTDPTVEEVREALERYEKHPGLSLADDPDLFVAVTRLWVAAAEPDIEAIVEVLNDAYGLVEGSLEYNRSVAFAVIAAAFGGNTLIRRADR